MIKSQEFLFEGADRIEYWASIGRTIRIGSLAELGVSDLERVRVALADYHVVNARAYLECFHPLYLDIITSYVEWALTWPAFLTERLSEQDARLMTTTTYKEWHRVITTLPRSNDNEAVDLLLRVFDPFNIEPNSIETFRHRQAPGEQTLASVVNEAPIRSYEAVLRAVEAGRFTEAAESYERYITEVRSRHDLLAKYVWAYASAVNKAFGQALAEEGLQCSLARCAFYEEMWKLVARVSPAELTALMAEELRAHFSGAGRQGAVEITEEPDCYRLIFDPCGSGGAMRREALEGTSGGFGGFTEPSPATWGRAGEVPVYCAHCAQNELVSLKRLGYPAWVTEFDPDANRPCGWTVYKDPALIPERYFIRLGVEKDPSKFRLMAADG